MRPKSFLGDRRLGLTVTLRKDDGGQRAYSRLIEIFGGSAA
jgi:hypothetical protein